MESILIGLVSLLAGAGIKTWFDRFQAPWVSRRNTAAEAFNAAVAVHTATLSSLILARAVDKQILAAPRDVNSIKSIAYQSDWYLRSHLDAGKARLEKLREVVLGVHAVWGPQVGALFDDFSELTGAWHNAFAAYRDDIHGNDVPDQGPLDLDKTGFDWLGVIQRTAHADIFERELARLLELVTQFAHTTGVAITELHQLPPGVREVVLEHEQHVERRQLAVAQQAALPPPNK